jgi:hypothetical protein
MTEIKVMDWLTTFRGALRLESRKEGGNMNGKLSFIIGVLAFSVLFLGNQAFASEMSSKGTTNPSAFFRPDVASEYAYSPQAPCLTYCSAADSARVYSYYNSEGHNTLNIPSPKMGAPAPSERSDIGPHFQPQVPTWY